ncbi:hypothetical protein BDY21DRAFT_331511 [Lineolata rhizophorae]|uniref:Uncharacterized protein n=1 Tax=Lineolata rhizophorae TaxID=578093 RepID=A0A6A6PBC6_9PEZI|nr:hypothetical protein BDY21DRAFT_331511 [Lineolata rhizophorae]
MGERGILFSALDSTTPVPNGCACLRFHWSRRNSRNEFSVARCRPIRASWPSQQAKPSHPGSVHPGRRVPQLACSGALAGAIKRPGGNAGTARAGGSLLGGREGAGTREVVWCGAVW